MKRTRHIYQTRLHSGDSVISPRFFLCHFLSLVHYFFLSLCSLYFSLPPYSTLVIFCLHTSSIASTPRILKINFIHVCEYFWIRFYVSMSVYVCTVTEYTQHIAIEWDAREYKALFTFAYKEKETVWICRNQSKVIEKKLLLVKEMRERDRKNGDAVCFYFRKPNMTRHNFKREIMCMCV